MSRAEPARTRFDDVAYPSLPHPAGDPDRMAVVARLHGLAPPDVNRARLLELGSADAGNLLALCAARPGALGLAIDRDATAIERGRRLAAAAGLDRAELRAADLCALAPADVGRAGYVVAHGVWSWVADEVREATLALAARAVTPDGVVAISYNALPGWHLWAAPRAIMRRASDREHDADAAARAAIGALEEAIALHGTDDLYGRVLRAALERTRHRTPAHLFHDDITDECTPFALGDVVARAAAHGLRYLGEALPEHWWAWRVDPPTADRLRVEAGPGAAERQAFADLASGTDFKVSLFVPERAVPAADADPRAALDLHASVRPDAPGLTATPPALRALCDALAPDGDRDGARARALPVRTAAAAARLEAPSAADAALRLAAAGQVRLHTGPSPAAVHAAARPATSALVRAQAERSPVVTTLDHGIAEVHDPAIRALVRVLDGRHERAELPAAAAAAAATAGAPIDADRLVATLDGTLARLARLGLIRA